MEPTDGRARLRDDLLSWEPGVPVTPTRNTLLPWSNPKVQANPRAGYPSPKLADTRATQQSSRMIALR
jgi:hypothetical protein